MLICPKCQSKNPTTNKFCQQCGTSLTEKVCPECEAKVALNLENCHNCGAAVGTVWWAIISRETAAPMSSSEVSPASVSLVEEQQKQAVLSAGDVRGVHFDSATTVQEELHPEAAVEETPSRDNLISEGMQSDQTMATPGELALSEMIPGTVNAPDVATVEVPEEAMPESSDNPTRTNAIAQTEVSAGDRNPFEEVAATLDESLGVATPPIPAGAYLDSLQRYQLLEPVPPPAPDGPTEIQVKVLDCQPFLMSPLPALVEAHSPRQIQPASANSLASMGIPDMAAPYLALNSQFSPTLPAIHDAWQQKGETVILLEDRSNLRLLLERWSDEELSPMQLLQWLYEMTELWAALSPWSLRSSLLTINNLRVNADSLMCIQRLYAEKPDVTLGLQDFGRLWQVLFQQSQRTQLGSITELLTDLRDGEIETVDVLRSRLVAIADEIEANSPAVAIDIDRDDEDMPTILLAMQLVGLESAGRTDIGRQRDHNEDSFGIETNVQTQEIPPSRIVRARCLYILCDGMGGHADGEVASAMAVDTLRRYFQTHWGEELPTEATIREAVLLANAAIYNVNQQGSSSGSGRMGTTLVLVLQQDTRVAVAHVGDSRLYRLTRRQGFKQITVDHEVGQREIKRGVDPDIAYSRPDAYQLTQALGPRDEDFIHPDVQFFELNEDTLLILASDGLTDNDLLEIHWKTHLEPLLLPGASLERGVSQLIDLANQYNGHDNITAIAIRAQVQPAKI